MNKLFFWLLVFPLAAVAVVLALIAPVAKLVGHALHNIDNYYNWKWPNKYIEWCEKVTKFKF